MGFKTWLCHWRSVAVNNPTLWTYIYISRPAPHDSATAYLARSGSTALLDLDLDMVDNFFDDLGICHWSSRVFSVGSSIDFLLQKGASVNRWKSLIVRAETPQVLYKTLESISPESAPFLRFLSLKWKTHVGLRTIEREVQSLEYLTAFDQAFSSSNDRFPQLRTVQFKTVPVEFIFRRPLPMFLGLTRLELTSASRLFSLPKLHALLSANLQLESLHLGARSSVGNLELTDSRVTLLSLRSLVLAWDAWDEVPLSWVLGTIKMIDAPAVEHLELASPGSYNEELLRLAEQLAPNVSENNDICCPGGQTISRRSIYPALQSINIAKLMPDGDCTEALQALLSALPTVTSLAASPSVLDLLGKAPWLLPRLERIKFFEYPPMGLVSILSQRIKDGSPLKTLEIRAADLQLVRSWGIKSLDIVKLPAMVVAEYYERDGDEE
ncbi:hypothetical protein FRC06_001381, partial [Ceratobasidium sp. 370]